MTSYAIGAYTLNYDLPSGGAGTQYGSWNAIGPLPTFTGGAFGILDGLNVSFTFIDGRYTRTWCTVSIQFGNATGTVVKTVTLAATSCDGSRSNQFSAYTNAAFTMTTGIAQYRYVINMYVDWTDTGNCQGTVSAGSIKVYSDPLSEAYQDTGSALPQLVTISASGTKAHSVTYEVAQSSASTSGKYSIAPVGKRLYRFR